MDDAQSNASTSSSGFSSDTKITKSAKNAKSRRKSPKKSDAKPSKKQNIINKPLSSQKHKIYSTSGFNKFENISPSFH